MALAFISCSKDDSSFKGQSSGLKTTIVTCGEQTWTLSAGQTIDAGTLTVSNDETNLYVAYTTTGVFGTLHLWVGLDMTLLPKNSQGTPVPGQFPLCVL